MNKRNRTSTHTHVRRTHTGTRLQFYLAVSKARTTNGHEWENTPEEPETWTKSPEFAKKQKSAKILDARLLTHGIIFEYIWEFAKSPTISSSPMTPSFMSWIAVIHRSDTISESLLRHLLTRHDGRWRVAKLFQRLCWYRRRSTFFQYFFGIRPILRIFHAVVNCFFVLSGTKTTGITAGNYAELKRINPIHFQIRRKSVEKQTFLKSKSESNKRQCVSSMFFFRRLSSLNTIEWRDFHLWTCQMW